MQALGVNPVKQERMVLIDVIRGFALLGVLISNTLIFAFPIDKISDTEQMLQAFVRIFVEGSFYPIFSFLFGFGLARQWQKAPDNHPVIKRRLVILGIIGLLHGLFIWSGDILLSYALVGFIALQVINKTKQSIKAVIVSLTILSVFIFFGLFALEAIIEVDAVNELGNLYDSGNYFLITQQRSRDYMESLLTLPLFIPQLLSFFLLGWLCCNYRLIEHYQTHKSMWRYLFFACSVSSLPIIYLLERQRDHKSLYLSFLESLDITLASPALGFAYMASIILLYDKWPRFFNPLSAIGKLSLSNYLAQSIVMTLIFYGYGAGLYNTLSLSSSLGIALILFALQVILSNLWLKAYLFGPAEWLWRCFSYKQFIPLKKSATALSQTLKYPRDS